MGTAASRPSISVIVSAFNWSTALRCALRSVQLQTFRDFEVLVVGDGCTDDSESVVNSFGDPRFRWHNLARNHGSQFAPNNYGLENAAGEWVAYLGQDDIWYPTHLEACIRAGTVKGADLVAAVMIMYGPPGSGVRAITGVFVEGKHMPGDLTPPSSVMHRRSLVERIGFWRGPEEIRLPVDCDFFDRATKAGALTVSTDELTVFKFNAAWRRDSYKLKDISEQESMLARIEAGSDFRQEELIEAMRAFVADKCLAANMPPPAPIGTYHRQYRRHRGADRWYADADMQSLTEMKRFQIVTDSLLEWHPPENHPAFGTFAWSGPLTRVATSFPVYLDQELFFRMHVIRAIDEASLTSLKIFVQDREVTFKSEMTPTKTYLFTWSAGPDPEADPEEPLRVTLDTGVTRRPRDAGINEDRRWLGLAVNWIEIGPARVFRG